MYKKILVPLDGSELAEKVLPQVIGLAKLTNAEIHLLRVVLVHTVPGADPTDRQVEAVHQAEEYIEATAGKLKKEGLQVVTHVRYGHEASEILDQVDHSGADLLAMCTHGRSGPTRWAMGSVSEKVVRRSPVPVLLIRASS